VGGVHGARCFPAGGRFRGQPGRAAARGSAPAPRGLGGAAAAFAGPLPTARRSIGPAVPPPPPPRSPPSPQFYTAAKPYAGLTREGIIQSVSRRGARPVFPTGAPRSFVDLATACWSTSPVDRPAFPDILGQLHAMADACAEQAAAAAAAPHPPVCGRPI
jgi:hypothetical protein